MARYAELHAHTNYSFLDGASDPYDLVARAAEAGLADAGDSVEVVSDQPTAQADIEELLRQRHRIAPGAESDFRIRNQKEILETMNAVTSTFTTLLAAIQLVGSGESGLKPATRDKLAGLELTLSLDADDDSADVDAEGHGHVVQ